MAQSCIKILLLTHNLKNHCLSAPCGTICRLMYIAPSLAAAVTFAAPGLLLLISVPVWEPHKTWLVKVLALYNIEINGSAIWQSQKSCFQLFSWSRHTLSACLAILSECLLIIFINETGNDSQKTTNPICFPLYQVCSCVSTVFECYSASQKLILQLNKY